MVTRLVRSPPFVRTLASAPLLEPAHRAPDPIALSTIPPAHPVRPQGESGRNSVSVHCLDAFGRCSQLTMDLKALVEVTGLPVRELRPFVSSYRRGGSPLDSSSFRESSVILPDEKCILVRMSFVKAAVFSDRLLVFDQGDSFAQEFKVDFSKRVLDSVGELSDSNLDFETKALEYLLDFHCVHLNAKLMQLYKLSMALNKSREQTTKTWHEAPITDHLEFSELLNLKNLLSSFENECKESEEAVSRILLNDEDLADMLLSKKQLGEIEKQGFDDVTEEARDPQDEVELVLENSLRNVLLVSLTCSYLLGSSHAESCDVFEADCGIQSASFGIQCQQSTECSFSVSSAIGRSCFRFDVKLSSHISK